MPACPQPLRIAGLLLALLVLTTATRASAQAAGPPVVPPPQTAYLVQPEADQAATTVRHGYFWLNAAPGQTRQVRVVVKNVGTMPLRLRSYAVDSIQEPTGGVDYGTWRTPRTQVGTWIRLSPATMTLAPGQARRVTATIRVPRGTGAGVHVGGLAFENARIQQQGRGSHVLIDVHYRRVIAVVLEAPGVRRTAAHVTDVTLTTAAPGSQAVVALRNSGTVLLTGTGTLTVTGRGTRTVATPFTLDTVLPAATDHVMVQLPTLTLQPGAYAVGVRVRSSAGAALIAWQGPVVVARPAVPTPPPNVTLPPVQALAHTAQRTPLVWIVGGAVLLLLLVVGVAVAVGVALGHRTERRRAA
jgi:hypothetical protein